MILQTSFISDKHPNELLQLIVQCGLILVSGYDGGDLFASTNNFFFFQCLFLNKYDYTS